MNSTKTILYYSILLYSYIFKLISAECDINPFGDNSPLVLNKQKTAAIYPQHGKKTLTLKPGEEIELACPQEQIVVGGSISQPILTASCVSGANLKVIGKTVQWHQIICSKKSAAVGRFLNSNCGINARLAEIGYILGTNSFLRLITICFDTKNETPLYSYYDLSSSIGSKDPTTARPFFYQDNGFYNLGSITVNQLYDRVKQRATINELVGLPATSTKYIDNGGSLFLARGHLTAKMDFIYLIEQNATFRYINAAPQWQSFNGGNWVAAEVDTRSYATNHNVGLQVWTGTYGVSTLPHEKTGKDTPLSLYVNGNNHLLPVPLLYWKIVFNPVTKKGIVLIGLNNPYEKNPARHVICPDISSQVHWLTWAKTNVYKGYSYACTISNFRKVVTYVPNLADSGLLL